MPSLRCCRDDDVTVKLSTLRRLWLVPLGDGSMHVLVVVRLICGPSGMRQSYFCISVIVYFERLASLPRIALQASLFPVVVLGR